MNNLNLDPIKSQFSGEWITPQDNSYDDVRALWNGMFDKKPMLVCRPKSIEDVQILVNLARENKVDLAIKGGGHNSAGTGSVDDGIMLDLSLLNHISVNPSTNRVKVQGGCLLGDVDKATQEYGLAVSSGIISHTGVGGLSLGGGMGWISRKHGLSVDNLISATLVAADGKIYTASADENSDLFWALKGGGGNFGVVVEFEFAAAKIGTEVYSGPIVKPFHELKSYLAFHRKYVRTMPDEMTIWLVARHAPPLPFIPEAYHGKMVILIPSVFLGSESEGKELLQPIRDHGTTIGDGTGMHPWTAWQSAFDGLVDHGARNYWKSHQLSGLEDECIDIIEKYASTMPSEECEVFIPHMEGAPSRISASETAYSHRTSPFVMNIHTRWQHKEDDEKCLKWARSFHKDTTPYSDGVYVNFISDDDKARAKDAYQKEVWDKLVEVKRKWDPDNVFHINQNITP